MNSSLDELYLTWLYSQVSSVKTKTTSRTHWSLLRQLYVTEFVWLVPNDDNRVEDGRDLRSEFLDVNPDISADDDWMDLSCSMLELLIGLSRVLSFESEGDPRVWFWHMLENLDLERFNDRVYKTESDLASRVIYETTERVIWRNYDRNGAGGLFPLKRPKRNQRNVELWYQLSAYLLERS